LDISSLSSQLRACRYPGALEYIECGILGSGFYPGASGFDQTQPPPQGGIMLLGRDWGKKSDYERFAGLPARGEAGFTWQQTRDVYLAGLAPWPVWCTNYLVGVRTEGSAEGNVKGRIEQPAWDAFESDCWSFLQSQVLLQRPLLVIVCGRDNRADLTVRGRFGATSCEELRHTFKTEAGEHSAPVVFGWHPNYLKGYAKQAAGREAVMRMRRLYEHEREKTGSYAVFTSDAR
jgi:hypothetical protein